MSSVAVIGVEPARRRRARRSLEADLASGLIVEFALAEDASSGMSHIVERLARQPGIERVEWWTPTRSGNALRLEAADGVGVAPRTSVPLGPLGVLILVGAGWKPQVLEAVRRLVPLLRRRWTEERLASHASILARRVEGLEDFAALVAHELKRPLQGALLAGDPRRGAEHALELVDSVLEAARSERTAGGNGSPRACLEAAIADLGGVEADVVAVLPDVFPLPQPALRLVLRNLVANAAAAGARQIRVSAVAGDADWTLVVDDDGTGIDVPGRYAAGSRLGLGLCSRLVGRLGGSLELEARPAGGTRATLRVEGSRA